MSIYRMVPFSGAATENFKAVLPSCYSQELEDCLNDPNAHIGSKCKIWYDASEASYAEGKETYKSALKTMPYCSDSKLKLAIAAVIGLLIGKILL